MDTRLGWAPKLVVLVAGAVAGWAGGTPQDHPDFIVKEGLQAVADRGRPVNFRYPSLVPYLHGALYGAIYQGLHAAGLVGTRDEFIASYRRGTLLEDPIRVPFFLPGHVLTVLFGALGTVAAMRIARLLGAGRIGEFSAGAATALAPVWALHAHFLTVDLPLGALCALAVSRALGLEGGLRAAASAGALCGIAASAKYPGALTFAALLPMILVSPAAVPRYKLAAIAIAAAAACAAFLLCNPYMLIEPSRLAQDFMKEWQHAKEGHFGHTTSAGFQYHFEHSLWHGFGWAPLALSTLGLVALVSRRAPRWTVRASFLIFPLLLFLLIGRSTLTFQRYLVPLVPFLAVLLGLGVEAIATLRFRGSPSEGRLSILRAAIALVLLGAALAPGTLKIIEGDILLGRSDMREDLVAALSALREPGPPPRVFADPQFVRGLVERSKLSTPEQIGYRTSEGPYDIVILDSFGYDRYLYHPEGKWQELPLEDVAASRVLVLSPFDRPKDDVPYAPESVYGPAHEDLRFRRRPGPYVEICVRDKDRLDRALARLRESGIEPKILDGTDSYYWRSVKGAR